MNHRRLHLLEKIQVQLATVAAVLVVYFAVWPMLIPADPQAPLTFLPTGAYVDAAVFAATVLLLAAVCSVVTVSSRPEGALLAALIGAAGASAHSAQIRSLLWMWEGRLPGLYGMLILEILLLAVVVFAAAGVVDLVRGIIARIRPNWLWRGPLIRLPDSESPGYRRRLFSFLIFGAFFRWPGSLKKNARKSPKPLMSLYCLGLGLLVGVILLLLLMRSPERGQIIFALLASFSIAAVVAHQVFPTPYSVVVWVVPLVSAVGFYVLAAVSAGNGNWVWMDMGNYARALPVDWLTAGCGGAIIGYWISERIHELRHIERSEEQGINSE